MQINSFYELITVIMTFTLKCSHTCVQARKMVLSNCQDQ